MQDKIEITIRTESVPGNLRTFQIIDLVKTDSTIILKNRNENDVDPVGVTWNIDEFDVMIELIKRNIERPVSNVTGKVKFSKQHICLTDGSLIEPESFHYNTKKNILSGVVLVGELVGKLKTEPPFKIELKEIYRLPIIQEMISLTDRVMKDLGLDAPIDEAHTTIQKIGNKNDPWFKAEEE